MGHEVMTLRSVTRDGVAYIAMPDLERWLVERIRRRGVERDRRVSDDPPSLRDPDPGPLLAAEVLEALRRGSVVGDVPEV